MTEKDSTVYASKLEDRKSRYLKRADMLDREAAALEQDANKKASVIPHGQPILIGHHSEGKDRRYRDRINKQYQQARELRGKAEYYREKAAAAGKAGIRSEDPEAVAKLEEKLADMEDRQRRMKSANKILRDKKLPDGEKFNRLVPVLGQVTALKRMKPDFMGRIGYPGWELQNNNANMRRVRTRIEELKSEALREEQAPQEIVAGVELIEDEGRVQFSFPDKPAADIRAALRRNGFKWSPSRGTWVRFSNPAGRAAAGRVSAFLKSTTQERARP